MCLQRNILNMTFFIVNYKPITAFSPHLFSLSLFLYTIGTRLLVGRCIYFLISKGIRETRRHLRTRYYVRIRQACFPCDETGSHLKYNNQKLNF